MIFIERMMIGVLIVVVMDGWDVLIVVGMNGRLLLIKHGFFVRIVVFGLYGYVLVCKWVVEIEVMTFVKR